MRHGSLFSGIGGFDLAAEWMGWENVFHCEWNDFGQRILKHYWPRAKSYGDITKTDFTIWRGRIDILTGGFPCQPYSQAGKRRGKDDDRHLWPEMLRAVREIEPTWIVGENVRGLVNWNGGMVFDEVQSDLETKGYEVLPLLLPACAVNAPHRRDRIWFVAHSDGPIEENGQRKDLETKREIRRDEKGDVSGELFGNGAASHAQGVGSSRGSTKSNGKEENASLRTDIQCQSERFGLQRTFTNSKGIRSGGLSERKEENDPINGINGKNGNVAHTRSGGRIQDNEQQQTKESEHARTGWERFPTQSPVCSRNDGLSERLDRITFPKWRSESIKGAGNAIVPQVAFEIFKAIETMQYDLERKL